MLANTTGIIVNSAGRILGSLALKHHNGFGESSTYTCTNLTCSKAVLDHGKTNCLCCYNLVRCITKKFKRKNEAKDSKEMKKLKKDNVKLKIKIDDKSKEKKALKRQLK